MLMCESECMLFVNEMFEYIGDNDNGENKEFFGFVVLGKVN